MKTTFSLSALMPALARPAIMFWTMPWLMVLLAAGTIAQKYIGLYEAQRLFFSSFVLWLGPVPLPGGYTTIGIVFLCLLAKFITESRWSWARSGIILAHFGALVLLAGGLLTALTAREGYVVIDEGAESAVIEDYHARVMTISMDGDIIATIPQKDLRVGRILGMDEGLPFNIEILSAMRNGRPEAQTDTTGAHNLPLRGPAAKVRMISIAPEIQNENNHGSVLMAVRGTGAETDGIYLATEIMPLYPQFDVKDHAYEVRFRKATTELPFALALSDITKETHPGMDMARAYRSQVTIKDEGTSWPAEISMNNPLRYKGYTFYQSSYIQRENGETTVLSAVWNAGRLFPYIASAIISIGLILHLLIALGLKRARVAALVFLLCLPFTQAQAETGMDMQDFRRIPVLHEGRLKPLETFAQIELQSFSGKTSLNGMSAENWLAELLFDPAQAADRPVFAVRNADLRMLLILPKQPGHLYSFAQILPAMQQQAQQIDALSRIDRNKLEARGRALLDLHEQISDYMQLMRSFSMILPLAVTPPDNLLNKDERAEFSGKTPSYMALSKLKERTDRKLKEIIRRKGEDPRAYTTAESHVATFAWQLDTLARSSEGNRLFRVIPVTWQDKAQTDDRVSPWAILQEGLGSPETATALRLWETLAQAWLDRDPALWRETAKQIVDHHPVTAAQDNRLQVERLYNAASPFQSALFIYALALVLFAAAHMRNLPRLAASASALFAAGIAVHTAGLVARVYLLARPPVGTLYESLLFVALICAIVGCAVCWKRRDALMGMMTALSSALLLGVSLYFGAISGDPLSMLVAVLNTNFWLATHVLIVTAGYGLSILSAVIAHAWLYQKAYNLPATFFPVMHRMALAALLFTAVGTILGGIWADQSWGRFWGWDPKENGALLIVLWILWLLHGRMDGALSQISYAAGLAALNIVVALAWFGVNLLSVGLHSYGFISGIAAGLAAFCLIETILITTLWSYARKKHHG